MADEIREIGNAGFAEELYSRWVADPSSVPEDWGRYFQSLSAGSGPAAFVPVSAGATAADKQGNVDRLIWAYRDVGYLQANLNPLRGYLTPGLKALRDSVFGEYSHLLPQEFGLSEADRDTLFRSSEWLRPAAGTISQIEESLREAYCGPIGVEFLHIQNKAMRAWLIENIELNNNQPDWDDDQRRRVLKDLIRAEEFELFIHSHFVGQKRFSIEGSEALLPALHYLIDRGAYESGIEEIVLGMTHRGRLNVLCNLLGRSVAGIFATFDSGEGRFAYTGSGDVRYHFGFSTDHQHSDGNSVHISLVPNPSHLEAVDPVVEGKTRGTQRRRTDPERKRVIPVLIHGDAAFTGQGVVSETFNFSQVRGYRTGGTIHIIVNNQIGFTTASADARSTFFPTDVAKSMPVPVFHVNGDCPEHVLRAIDLALRFRQTFLYDAVVDIFCYRKHGHNESDDPTFTHPMMYEKIRELPSVATQYGRELDRKGVFPAGAQAEFRESYRRELTRAFAMARTEPPRIPKDAFQEGEWRGLTQGYDHSPIDTGVDAARMRDLAAALCRVPPEVKINPKLDRILEERRQRLAAGKGLDWATAEALAFGSLLTEGIPVRLSGEDSGRGTFSHRHAVWWNIANYPPEPYMPLNYLAPGQAKFTCYDSPLSEYSVLGFEYGLAMSQPRMLTLWEAQFGDFVNGAQVVIDQFIVSGEAKWQRSNGLVLLLPHGFSGQGPEHSNAHLERFLQLCAEDNIQVCNMTTPAQYFHVLRRQMLRRFRKPLIIMAPKALLRDKRAVSALADLERGQFHEILDDPAPGAEQARTLIFCSGQVYYDLVTKRESLGGAPVAIVRFEQFYPFPGEPARRLLEKYARVEDYVWVQEEPRNRGGWSFMREYLEPLLGLKRLRYAGRPASATVAAGSYAQHQSELEAFLNDAFNHKRGAGKAK